MIARSERVLREGVLDALGLTSVPDDGMDHSACTHPGCMVARRLREAITEARESPEEHPEDFCEACREPFEPWHAPTDDWEAATGRRWGGPIICQPCFALMLGRRRLFGASQR